MTARLTVVGLGPAGPELLTAETVEAIAAVPPAQRWVRTTRHPSAAAAGTEQSFDDAYEQEGTFGDVYARIASELNFVLNGIAWVAKVDVPADGFFEALFD